MRRKQVITQLERDLINIFTNTSDELRIKDKRAEVGKVLSVGDGIATISGLRSIKAGEMINFSGNVKGMALNLNEYTIGAVIFGDERKIKQGDRVSRTNSLITFPVGFSTLGRILDVLGRPIDGKGSLSNVNFKNVEVKAPGIIARQSVNEPMQTGLKAIDALVPIGRGQRELIIGDRQTGKTAVAIDAILNQFNNNCDKKGNFITNKKKNLFCVYVAIGQKKSTVAQISRTLEKKKP